MRLWGQPNSIEPNLLDGALIAAVADGVIPAAEIPDSLGAGRIGEPSIPLPGMLGKGIGGMGKAIEITQLERSAADLRGWRPGVRTARWCGVCWA